MSAQFYVKDTQGHLVPAQFLTFNGQFITDVNKANAQNIHLYTSAGVEIGDGNLDGFVVAQFGFSLDKALTLGGMLSAALKDPDPAQASIVFSIMKYSFSRGGPEDLQRSYTDIDGNTVPGGFVSAFQDVASIYYGATAAVVGFSKAQALQYACIYNSTMSS